MNNIRPGLGLTLVASLTLGLAACGGGGGDSGAAAQPAAIDSVPDSALTSSTSFVDFQKGLAASDTIEPLTLQQLLPPTDDTIEPFSIG